MDWAFSVVGSRCVSLHQWYLRISILDLSFLIQCLELGRAELAKETQEIVLKTAPVCILFHWWPSPGLLKVCCLTSVHHFSLSTPRKSHQWGQMSKVIQAAKPWKYSLHGKKKNKAFFKQQIECQFCLWNCFSNNSQSKYPHRIQVCKRGQTCFAQPE